MDDRCKNPIRINSTGIPPYDIRKGMVIMIYSISETARLLGVAPSTLRYYDKEGLLPFIDRSPGGIRQFQEKDFAGLRLIQCLKQTGLSIRDIREFIDLPEDGEETIEKRLSILGKQQKILEQKQKELQDMIDVVNYKLWYYQTAQKAGTTRIPGAAKTEDIPLPYRRGKEKLHALPGKEST